MVRLLRAFLPIFILRHPFSSDNSLLSGRFARFQPFTFEAIATILRYLCMYFIQNITIYSIHSITLKLKIVIAFLWLRYFHRELSALFENAKMSYIFRWHSNALRIRCTETSPAVAAAREHHLHAYEFSIGFVFAHLFLGLLYSSIKFNIHTCIHSSEYIQHCYCSAFCAYSFNFSTRLLFGSELTIVCITE